MYMRLLPTYEMLVMKLLLLPSSYYYLLMIIITSYFNIIINLCSNIVLLSTVMKANMVIVSFRQAVWTPTRLFSTNRPAWVPIAFKYDQSF